MTVFRLVDDIFFPDPNLSNEDGLLAVDGDLSVERILLAYESGIFPWFEHDDEILWWSPNPRLILKLNDFKISKSLKRTLKSNKYIVKFDTCFPQVVESCSSIKRNGEHGTWITEGMKNAFINLYKMGIAHSVEIFENNTLVGGLYGLEIGKVFCGESMFHNVTDASKVALYHLVELLKENNFSFIDAQMPTDHLKSMGAVEIKKTDFLRMLKDAIKPNPL